jgi:poly(A) polymerase
MKLLAADWQSRDGMSRLLAALGADKGATRYVGGCVRDTMLGLPVSDVDLATRLQPTEVEQRLKQARIKSVPTGIAHGTITAVLSSGPIEVTTLRRDVETDGRHATVAFTDDWQADAARRDFTINALSADPASLTLFDYFGGAEDLRTAHVRFIGNARERIAEDHLRILRFFRFHARFGSGEADAEAIEACTERANDLMALSRERIADELIKLLALPRPFDAVALMVDRGILRAVIPEIERAGIERLQRLLAAETRLDVAPDPYRRLAALLPADPVTASDVATRLRLSNKAVKRLASAADRTEPAHGDPRLLAYNIGKAEAADRLLLDPDGDDLAARLASLDGWERPRLPLSGGDLIAMGLKAGPLVSRTLQAIEREWAQSGFSQDRSAVEQLARRHVDQLLRSSQ